MGLIMAGTATDKATEMLAYAHDTQHEKIIRGTVLGLALVRGGCIHAGMWGCWHVRTMCSTITIRGTVLWG